MKRFSNLYNNVFDYNNLYSAMKQAIKGKKDKSEIEEFSINLELELIKLKNELINSTYFPQSYKRFKIYDPKHRIINAPAFRDRVVHHALCNVIEPILDKSMIFESYACRKNKGLHKAIERVKRFTKLNRYFLKCDINKYFASIDHDILLSLLYRKIKDRRIISFIKIVVDSYCDSPEKGLPIGSLTSQIFANYYLSGFDHFIKERLKYRYYVRYMDDFILFDNVKERLKKDILKIKQFLNSKLELQLNEKVTMYGSVLTGISFLGFRFYPGIIRLSKLTKNRFFRKFRRNLKKYLSGKITEDYLISSTNSMIDFIKNGNSYNLRKKCFEKFA